jgi:hypothetical protein
VIYSTRTGHPVVVVAVSLYHYEILQLLVKSSNVSVAIVIIYRVKKTRS